ncbi:MAG: hypothetical protein IT441_09520 [Phycisphaeraceae bacterium]|nr:hypothetical protein [Phycisphaeraceae bacterium]
MDDLPRNGLEALVRFVCGFAVGFLPAFFWIWLELSSAAQAALYAAGIGLVPGLLATLLGNRFWGVFRYLGWFWGW